MRWKYFQRRLICAGGLTCFPAAFTSRHKARVDFAAPQQLVYGVKLSSCSATIQWISIVVTHDDE
jgi:hypothetical protein